MSGREHVLLMFPRHAQVWNVAGRRLHRDRHLSGATRVTSLASPSPCSFRPCFAIAYDASDGLATLDLGYGGWLRSRFPSPSVPVPCPTVPPHQQSQQFLGEYFKAARPRMREFSKLKLNTTFVFSKTAKPQNLVRILQTSTFVAK
jgi:hypothetical protein